MEKRKIFPELAGLAHRTSVIRGDRSGKGSSRGRLHGGQEAEQRSSGCPGASGREGGLEVRSRQKISSLLWVLRASARYFRSAVGPMGRVTLRRASNGEPAHRAFPRDCGDLRASSWIYDGQRRVDRRIRTREARGALSETRTGSAYVRPNERSGWQPGALLYLYLAVNCQTVNRHPQEATACP